MIAWLVLLQTSLTIAVAGPVTSPEYLPLHVAQAEGLFAAQHLAVTLRSMRSEEAAAEALGGRHVELAATSLDSALRLASASADGAPPRLVLGLTAAPPVALLVPTARAATIHSVADLVGQTVAVPAPGTLEDRALGVLLAQAGIPPHRVILRNLGERGVVRAIEAGEVPAAVLADPHVTRLVEEGRATLVADLRSSKEAARWLGGPSVNAALFARADPLPDPATLQALVTALQVALARVTSAEPASLQPGLPAAVVGSTADFAARLQGARDVFLPGGRVSAEAVEHAVALVRRRAPLPAKVKVPRRAERLLLD